MEEEVVNSQRHQDRRRQERDCTAPWNQPSSNRPIGAPLTGRNTLALPAHEPVLHPAPPDFFFQVLLGLKGGGLRGPDISGVGPAGDTKLGVCQKCLLTRRTARKLGVSSGQVVVTQSQLRDFNGGLTDFAGDRVGDRILHTKFRLTKRAYHIDHEIHPKYGCHKFGDNPQVITTESYRFRLGAGDEFSLNTLRSIT